LLFTRRKEANPAIAEQFERRRVEKKYLACVTGLVARDKGVLHHKLIADRHGAMRALPARVKQGQEAITRFRVLERVGERALLELSPETGRTHQLRVQLAAEHMPIAGDPLYGNAGGASAPRLLLHAAELRLRHPSTGRPLVVHSKLPPQFSDWLHGREPNPFEGVDTIERALREAAELRYGLGRQEDTTAFRIANSGGDGIPGVAVDVYDEWLVISLSSEEAERAKEAILDAAFRLGPKGVYLKVRPKHASVIVDPRRDQFAPRKAQRGEDAPEPLVIHELGVPYRARLGEGLSTGIFLDQRENRRRVREMAGGKRVLNLFAYTGAFSVVAALGGARATVTVDVSPGVLAWAQQNLDAIGADRERHTVVEADAIPWLEFMVKKGERFDLVILDPPSFATTKKTQFSAASDYRSLAALALRALAPGGRLLACTNHRGIVRAKFRRFLHEAARDAGREVVQMKDMPDPVDFPPDPGCEPHLKSVLVTIAQSHPRAR